MPSAPRKITREKGVEICTDFLFSGKKTADIVRECGEQYGVKRSAVEKWMQLARPKVEILRQEANLLKMQGIEKSVAESAARLNISRDKVLERLWRIANGNLQDFFTDKTNMVPIGELPRETAALLASVEVDELYHGNGDAKWWAGQTKKLRLLDPLKAIDMINKMQGWYKDDAIGPTVQFNIGYGKEVPV